jgi:MFS family permease
VYTLTILLATLFEIGCALSPSLPALIILRLFAGFFSAAPLSNAGGSLNDIGNPIFRTLGLPLFTTTGFVGPILGPIIGSYVAENLGWRWCYWITAIWNAASFVLVVGFMPETLGGALLKYKAVAWRAESESRAERESESDRVKGEVTGGNAREGTDKRERRDEPVKWRAEIEDESFGVALSRSLKRPFIMLVKEPILVFFSVYLTGTFRWFPISHHSPYQIHHDSLLYHNITSTPATNKPARLTTSRLYMPIRSLCILPTSLLTT